MTVNGHSQPSEKLFSVAIRIVNTNNKIQKPDLAELCSDTKLRLQQMIELEFVKIVILNPHIAIYFTSHIPIYFRTNKDSFLEMLSILYNRE